MITIKNMKMPSGCYDCPFAKNKKSNDYGSFCECGILEDYETINLLEHSKFSNCPLGEQEPTLDKISSEIEEIETYDGIYIDRAYVLEIIDKYKEKQEET